MEAGKFCCEYSGGCKEVGGEGGGVGIVSPGHDDDHELREETDTTLHNSTVRLSKVTQLISPVSGMIRI
jgi:hypothetical protein